MLFLSSALPLATDDSMTVRAHTGLDHAGFVERADEGPLLGHLVRPHFTQERERLIIFAFDAAERLVGMAESGAAQARKALLVPAMVRQAFSYDHLSHLLLAHNHPSQAAAPSRCDIDLTRQLTGAADLMGIVMRDHVILTASGHFSFRRAGLL